MNKKISASLLLSIGTLGSYLMGFIREPLFGHAFGASSLTDAYFKAFQIPDFLFLVFITSALLGLVTPLFLQEKEKNRIDGYRLFGNFFGVLSTLYLIAIGIVWVFLDQIFELFFYNTYITHPTELVTMGKIFLVSNFIFGISNCIGTFAMAHKRFISTALAPILYNLGIIGGIFFFAETFGIYAPAYGAIAGALLHLSIRLVEYFSHTEKFLPHWDIKNPLLQELAHSMVLRWMTVTAIPLMLMAFGYISEAEEGLYTLFRYTHNLQSAPVAIFGLAFATASFPYLSELFAQHKIQQMMELFWNSALKILFWTLPASIGMFFLGGPILALLYNLPQENFAFILPFLAIAIPVESTSALFARACNALKKTHIPMIANIFLLFGALLSVMLFSSIKDVPLAIALSASYLIGFVVQMSYYIWVFRKENLLQHMPQKFSTKIMSILFPSVILMIGGIFLQIFVENFSPVFFLLLGIPIFSILFFGVLLLAWKKKFVKNIKSMM